MVVDSSPDTEITLGTAKLLGLFFGLVIVCAVFFALGYTLGRKTEAGMPSAPGTTATTSSNVVKPAGSATQTAPPMTFYKAVEQKDTNAQLTPATSNDAPAAPVSENQPAQSSGTPATQSTAPTDSITIPTSGYFVQVAAVSKQDDAQALVDALKKKEYAAFVANSTDKLFRVQIGPFADIKEAEATRGRLVNDGYTPILKK
jgi:DedD protein